MSISQTAGRSRYRLASIAVFVALFLMVSVPAVSAYEDDTHFWLTYYLSRRAGYTHVRSTPNSGPDPSATSTSPPNPSPRRSDRPPGRSFDDRRRRPQPFGKFVLGERALGEAYECKVFIGRCGS